jgi:hypothetical protein
MMLNAQCGVSWVMCLLLLSFLPRFFSAGRLPESKTWVGAGENPLSLRGIFPPHCK